MVAFDNAKRMERLKDYLKENIKQSKGIKSSSSCCSSSSGRRVFKSRGGLPSLSSDRSGNWSVSSKKSTASCGALSRRSSQVGNAYQDPSSNDSLDTIESTHSRRDKGANAESHNKDAKRLLANWNKIKQKTCPVDFGEQVALKMIELNPACRQSMRIETFRGSRFEHICTELAAAIEAIVSLMDGPDCDRVNLAQVATRLQSEGILPELFATALPSCVKTVLGSLTALETLEWEGLRRALPSLDTTTVINEQ